MIYYTHQCSSMFQVVQVDDIPLLVNGKIDRQLLLKDYDNDLKSWCG